MGVGVAKVTGKLGVGVTGNVGGTVIIDALVAASHSTGTFKVSAMYRIGTIARSLTIIGIPIPPGNGVSMLIDTESPPLSSVTVRVPSIQFTVIPSSSATERNGNIARL